MNDFPRPPVNERSYTVGLPVTITVTDDGVVSLEVDLSEATEAIDDLDLDELPHGGAVAREHDTVVIDDVCDRIVPMRSASITLEPSDDDGAPCCLDPGCPGRGSGDCTFPGYADNH